MTLDGSALVGFLDAGVDVLTVRSRFTPGIATQHPFLPEPGGVNPLELAQIAFDFHLRSGEVVTIAPWGDPPPGQWVLWAVALGLGWLLLSALLGWVLWA